MHRALASLALFAGLAGCASASLPICPRLAAASYVPPRPEALVNRHLDAQTRSRGIEVAVLSPFVARFKGSTAQVRWLRKHYKHLVCGFEARQLMFFAKSFGQCHANAEKWMAAVDGGRTEELIVDESLYRDTCIDGGVALIPAAPAARSGEGDHG